MLISGCQSMPEINSENTSKIKNINVPNINNSASVSAGEVMYTNINKIGTIILKPNEQVVITTNNCMFDSCKLSSEKLQAKLNQNSIFYKGSSNEGNIMICSLEAIMVMKSSNDSSFTFCLVEGEVKGLFDKIYILGGSLNGTVYTPNVPTFTETELSFNPNGPTSREIVFDKLEADNLFFTYKEYKDNQVIKTQPVTQKVSSLPFSVVIKDAEFLITEIKDKLQFTVNKVMKSSIDDETLVNCISKKLGKPYKNKLNLNRCAAMYGVAFPD